MVSLFSGIGGFEIAGELMGWDIVSSCEINPFCQKILKYYWPNAYHHDNVKTLDYEKIKDKIDPSKPTIIVGGFPCQPFSIAGKRKGSDDERYGWPDCIKAVRLLRPNWCLFENVFGIVNWNGGMVFDEVQADLEAEGYEVQPYVLPACAVNAPHRRDRVWFVAYRNGNGFNRGDSEYEVNTSEGGFDALGNTFESGINGVAADTCGPVLKERHVPGKSNGSGYSSGICIAEPPTWNNFPTQPPVRGRNDGLSEYLDGITFSKWRNESIKAYGNAIVPQVALQIFKAIEAYSSFK